MSSQGVVYVCARFQKKRKQDKTPNTSEFYAEKFRIGDPRALSVEQQHQASAWGPAIVVYVSSSESAQDLY